MSTTIDVANLAVGSITANTLAAGIFTNPACTVIQNTDVTPLNVKYLRAVDYTDYVIKLEADDETRDAEVTTWVASGYVYFRLNSSGKAIYFRHNVNTANGDLDIGIVTGLNETTYPSGTSYVLWRTTDCVGLIPGYSPKSDTTGDAFTFGVSGFDIYAKFNGTEFVRFKEYRHTESGAVAMKALDGYGFRNIVWTGLADASLFSTPSSNILDLRDWNVRPIQTTGTISASSSSLVIASDPGFQVGDWVIVEIGHETGAGARGTIGVGGQWPTKSYANTAAMNADVGQTVNTYAWTLDDGIVKRWGGASWSASGLEYYVAKAIPKSLHGRITAIAGLTLTIDTTATATATNANVYLDNQPYINYLTGNQDDAPNFVQSLAPITPAGVTIIIPEGSHAASGVIKIRAQASWIIKGVSQSTSVLFAPDGVYSLCFKTISGSHNYNVHTFRDFTLIGNWGLEGYGFASSGWSYIPGGMTPTGLMNANEDTDDNSTWLTQTNIPRGFMYPPGILIGTDDTTAQDVTVKEVSQDAFGASFVRNSWCYRCTNIQTQPLQNYIQWQFQWANCTGGGFVDCVLTSTYPAQGFESFVSDDTQMTRCTLTNGVFSFNNSEGWLVEDCVVTWNADVSATPTWGPNQPLVVIGVNTGSDNVARGGTIRNIRMTVAGRLNADNDVIRGIVIDTACPDIVITGGSYAGPNYAAPSGNAGPAGIVSDGTNTRVSCFSCDGTVNNSPINIFHANIGITSGSVVNSRADDIVTPTGSGNVTTAFPLPSICGVRVLLPQACM